MSTIQAYEDRRDDPRAEAALSLWAELEGAELRVDAQVGPRGVVASLERCSRRRRSRNAGRRLASFEVRASDGGLGDRAGRWASGWSMVAVYPTRLAPKADPFAWMFEQARERLSFERMLSGREPADGNAHRRRTAPGTPSLAKALRHVAEEMLRRLDGKRLRLARRVHPVMRWWLYDVGGAMRREFGAEGERNLRQAVECMPGVLLFAFALDDPRDPDRFDAITEVLRHIGRSSRRAPQLAGDLVHVWMSMRKRRGWLTRRNRRGGPAGEPRRDEPRRAFDYGGATALVMMSAGLGDEALVRAQRLLVLRASRHVHPDLLLVPAPPHWAPEDLPADPRASARWFGVVQGARCHGPYGAIRDMARRRHGAWEPAFSGFVSANALALWHPCPSILAERIAAIEMWAWANGRRPCRASNPATLLAESAAFVRLVGWKMHPGRGGATPIEFRVPATLAFEGDGIRVEPIRTATELLAEAERMRNCLGDRLDRCAAGTYVVCRAHVKGELWSLGLCRQANRWRLAEVGGRFDCRMPWDVFEALEPYFEAADILVPGRSAPDRRETDAPPTPPEPTGARALRLEKPGGGLEGALDSPRTLRSSGKYDGRAHGRKPHGLRGNFGRRPAGPPWIGRASTRGAHGGTLGHFCEIVACGGERRHRMHVVVDRGARPEDCGLHACRFRNVPPQNTSGFRAQASVRRADRAARLRRWGTRVGDPRVRPCVAGHCGGTRDKRGKPEARRPGAQVDS